MSLEVVADGNGMFFTIGGTQLQLEKVSPKVSPKLVDTTDTATYDAVTGLVWQTQKKVAAPVELSIEGNFRKSAVTATFLSACFAGGGPYAVTFGLNTDWAHFTGSYDISEFQITAQVMEKVTFTATLKSNGVIS